MICLAWQPRNCNKPENMLPSPPQPALWPGIAALLPLHFLWRFQIAICRKAESPSLPLRSTSSSTSSLQQQLHYTQPPRTSHLHLYCIPSIYSLYTSNSPRSLLSLGSKNRDIPTQLLFIYKKTDWKPFPSPRLTYSTILRYVAWQTPPPLQENTALIIQK